MQRPAMAATGLEGLEPHYDLVIVGCGLSGAVFAEQAAARLGWTSLIIDKRDHIGAPPRITVAPLTQRPKTCAAARTAREGAPQRR